MSTTPIGNVLARLGPVRKQPGGFAARCPAHADGNPSLSVGEGDDGRVVLHCHAGCDTDVILNAVGLDWSDLFPPKPEPNGYDQREVAAYDYVDERGTLLFQKVRYTPKAFRQRRPDGNGGWIWRLGDVRQVLYRLPDVLLAGQQTVYVVEGEKDADTLARAGYIATTNPGGAGKWRREFNEFLKGVHVVVVRDRDEPGAAHAAQVAASLRGVARTLRVVEPAVGKDTTDHFVAGKTVEDFIEVRADIEPPPGGGIKLIRASAVTPEHTRWLWHHRIVLRGLSLTVGMEGKGKSTLLAALIGQATRGTLEGDLRGQAVSVVYVTAEDSTSATVVPRLTAAGADLERVHFVTIDGLGAAGLTIPGDLPALAAVMAEVEARFLIVDPVVAHLHGTLDSHKDQQVRHALTPLAQWADSTNAAVLGVMHFNKGISTDVLDRVNGSRGFTAAARSLLTVGDNPEDQGERVVAVGKSNLAPAGVPSLRFRIEGRTITHPAVEGPIETSGIAWLGEAKGVTSRDLLGAAVSDEDRSARQEAADWLCDLLGKEPVPANDVKAKAEKAGLAWATVRRAKSDVGVVSKRWGRPGEEGGWCWSLADVDCDGAQDPPKVLTSETRAPSAPDEHLRGAAPSQFDDLTGPCRACGSRTGLQDGRDWQCSRCRTKTHGS